MDFEILPDETLEDLQLKGYFILQKKEAFRFGMDAVLLSNFVASKKHRKILDLGTGTGIIPILLAAKTTAASIVGLEIQAPVADMAERSIAGNALSDRIRIVQGDIRLISNYFAACSFDCVAANPPYTAVGSGFVNPQEPKAISRHEVLCTLEDVLDAAYYALKPSGDFYMVHRPDRLTDILEGMRRKKLEPKLLRFVCAREGKAPSLILVKGLKNGSRGLKILPSLIIFDADGGRTEESRIRY